MNEHRRFFEGRGIAKAYDRLNEADESAFNDSASPNQSPIILNPAAEKRRETLARRYIESQQYQESYFYYSTIDTISLPHPRRGKILIVEDCKIAAKANAYFLGSLGYHIDIAYDGKSAMNLFDETYQVIMSDLFLPDIDGLALIRYFRSQEKYRRTPIVLLTVASDDREGECRRAGIDLFVQKPLPVADLAKILHRLGVR